MPVEDVLLCSVRPMGHVEMEAQSSVQILIWCGAISPAVRHRLHQIQTQVRLRQAVLEARGVQMQEVPVVPQTVLLRRTSLIHKPIAGM